MKIEENCRTCKWYQEEESDEKFMVDPCIACIKNPNYQDEWELENSIIKEEKVGK